MPFILAVAVLSAAVGWVACYVGALMAFRNYQTVDLSLPDDE